MYVIYRVYIYIYIYIYIIRSTAVPRAPICFLLLHTN